MSTKLKKINIINLIKKKINLFYSFNKVYIFGSILEKDKYSNDIDILLLYSSFSFNIQESIGKIKEYVERVTFYPVDIIALSLEEEKEINFIDRLNKKYICLI
mgnify:CR=1 FL=1